LVTEDEIQDLHKILLPKLLPRAGFKFNFPYTVAFAPQEFLGVGIKHLKAIHLALQVEMLLKHIRANNSVGKTAKIMIRWAQKVTGIAKPVLEDRKRVPHLEGGWVANIQDGLITCNAKIRATKPWTILHQRVNNQHIMDIIRNDQQLSDLQVTRLNYCRLYLKVELLSHITTSD
jgi:hypothetical protein